MAKVNEYPAKSAAGNGDYLFGHDASGERRYPATVFATKSQLDAVESRIPTGGNQGSYTLPVATNTTLGGVKPVSKTSSMTQDVGVDSSGKLYTAPGGGQSYSLPTASNTVLGGVKPVTKTTAMTQSVGVDSSGRLYTTPSSGDVAVSQTVTSGVEIAKVNGISIYLPDGRSERY